MKKKVLAVLLIMYFFINLIFVVAFWDNTVDAQNMNIELGYGVTLEVEETLSNSDKSLIPEGSVLKENDVLEVLFNYNVKLDAETLNTFSLDVVVENILVGESHSFSSLVNFEVVKERDTLDVNYIWVTVKVTLSQPESLEAYQSITGKEITFTVKFSAV